MNYTPSDYQLVDNVAADLIDRNGTTTTLEIKEELRQLYPGAWYQTVVSEIMKELSDVDGKYEYDDDGHHRTYRTPTIIDIFDEDDDDIFDDVVIIDIIDNIPIEDDSSQLALPPAKGSILTRLRNVFKK